MKDNPDVAIGELPSESETFRQLAEVLATGRIEAHRSTHQPNTHWKNWPLGGVM
jgi:hypothetical protein